MTDTSRDLSWKERLARRLLGQAARLPLGVFRGLGWVAGHLLYGFAHRRRGIVLRNLGLCFPQWPTRRRHAVARRNMVYFMQTLLDRVWLWHAPLATLERRIQWTGDLSAFAGDHPVVVFAPHFMGLDVGGLWFSHLTQRKWSFIYVPQKGPGMDRWVNEGRTRFGNLPIPRKQGIMPILRHLRAGGVLHLSPDMDLGRKNAVFAPFFGRQAATITSLGRLSALAHAPVLSLLTRVTPAGYQIELSPPWPDFPSGDDEADATAMNRQLEGYVLAMVDQYHWPHRRFKSRPPGEPNPYR
jgi:Kdo2-lipid IVA lauroyltransferase/acyltransferase